MAAQIDEALGKIHQYLSESRELQDVHTDADTSSIEARLELTLQELQTRVQQQQAALEKIRASSTSSLPTTPSDEAREKLKQLLILKDVYKRLTPTEPFLPNKPSILPALLAACSLQQTIVGTKEAIASTQSQLQQKTALLRREEANLHDADLITMALESRIEKLQTQHTARTEQSPTELAHDLISAHRAQKLKYEDEMIRLSKAFDDFRTDYLAPMLAAEELGGPVVGSLLDVGEETLAAGFTKRGAAKKSKTILSDSTRQKRIDQIWGGKTYDDQPMSELESASDELRELMEDLFLTMTTVGSGGYHQLERDSAAARFLVRSKVAQFHPKDARKLRLIDFGRELDD
ncbi:hypothetical protein GQ43DRAFT_444281 [Delitschia confertaspora ATCC 74209]|uniref:Centromere protein Cenp-K n=1 Tax=Delitschia confertaspora ATCC 74209 TaxID=1513339 RepID=A0A9P4JDF7_9PLEO|nr:hypothetical protein GQ43DRAFT_444281 [Delitschia confertaspora ATCC 74209]